MSQEFSLAWPCPHLTVEERVSLAPDRMSLQTRQPVGGAGTVRILINDEFYIPQMGLSTPAQLKGSASGPFDILPGEDTLVLTCPTGSQTVTLGIKAITRYTAAQVVKEFKRLGLTNVLVGAENDHLLFADFSTVGPGSFVRVSGSAATAFGFGAPKGVGNCGGVNYQWRASGRLLYPGWSLFTRPDEITNRFPKFNEPLVGNPVIKVTYTVPPQRCLRCGGTYIENDYRFDSEGKAVLITNENLLYQAALKILLTDRGSNVYHPWYGTYLRSRVGSKALAGVASLINEDVRRALRKLQNVQEQKAKYQAVSFKERLYDILSVDVYPHAQDPTTYMIEVVVQNASAEPINLSIVFTVPEVVALMGSNGLALGNEIAGLNPGRVGVRNSPLLLTDGE